MKKLLCGIAEFRRGLTPESRALFARLALGQKPDALFIACSDSRVVPNLFASTNPGDLFVIRNIGNLIPPCSQALSDASAAAAIEFSIRTLQIADIIVCGHSECGAMQSLVDGFDRECCPGMSQWLTYGQPSLERTRQGDVIDPTLTLHNQVSQINVLQQMQHLATYPLIQQRMANKKLRIHGWWFDIAHADVYCFEQRVQRFVLIDEQEAELILQRLNESHPLYHPKRH